MELTKRNKPLILSPLKLSQPMGATLATLGIEGAIPLLHGSQGCTAFAKVFFVRHFREPIPLQTTALDQVAAVMSPDDNALEGLATVAAKANPRLISLISTGLTETEGTDLERIVRTFRLRFPEYRHIAIVPVSAPDFIGSLENGFAAAVEAMIRTLAGKRRAKERRNQINLLVGAHLTPGDVEYLKTLVEAFDLQPIVIPDLSDSLDGHLIAAPFSPVTVGGTPIEAFSRLSESLATIVVGRSLWAAADLLAERTAIPDYRFDHLLGIEATDSLIALLSDLSGRPVPPAIERQRARLEDAMVDTHFMLGFTRWAIATEPDLLHAYAALAAAMGAEVPVAVASTSSPLLKEIPAGEVIVGDLDDLEAVARRHGVDLLLSNSHALATAERLGVPLHRIGLPQHDRLGGAQRAAIGYLGTRQLLFDLANLILEHHRHDVPPYRSRFRPSEEAHATHATCCPAP